MNMDLPTSDQKKKQTGSQVSDCDGAQEILGEDRLGV